MQSNPITHYLSEADKISETVDRQGSDYRSLGEDDYERDSAADQARPTASISHTQSNVRRGSSQSGNRVVYGKLQKLAS